MPNLISINNVPSLYGLPEKYVQSLNTYLKILSDCSFSGDILKIFLFGSCAKGTFTSKSDIDILVLLRNDFRDASFAEEEFFYESFDKLYGLVPADVLFVKEQAFQDNLNRASSVYFYIAKDGVTLYEQ